MIVTPTFLGYQEHLQRLQVLSDQVWPEDRFSYARPDGGGSETTLPGLVGRR